MDNVDWRLFEHWRISKQIAEECRAVDQEFGVEEEGELGEVVRIR